MIEYKLLRALNEFHLVEVTKNVIKKLSGSENSVFLLSGDDSGLKNTWEEICVHVQGQESFHWEAYKDTIKGLAESELEKLPRAVYDLICYMGNLENL